MQGFNKPFTGYHRGTLVLEKIGKILKNWKYLRIKGKKVRKKGKNLEKMEFCFENLEKILKNWKINLPKLENPTPGDPYCKY